MSIAKLHMPANHKFEPKLDIFCNVSQCAQHRSNENDPFKTKSFHS